MPQLRRYAPHAGLDSTFGSHALVSGSKPYGGAIIARSDGAPPQPVGSGARPWRRSPLRPIRNDAP